MGEEVADAVVAMHEAQHVAAVALVPATPFHEACAVTSSLEIKYATSD